MNEQLQQKLTTLLEWTEKAAQTSTKFVAEQTPLLIQEILRYNFWTSLVWFVFGLLVILSSCYGAWRLAKYLTREEEWDNEGPFILLFLIPLVIGGIVVTTNTDWFKICVAPRLYVVDYLRSEIGNK